MTTTNTPKRTAGLATALALLLGMLGHFEGDRYTAYRDLAGIWTICEGETHGVKAGDTATPEQCRQMTTSEALRSLSAVDAALTIHPPPARWAALADFQYNVGQGNFLRSGVLRRINAGDIQGGCDELRRWVYVRGRVIGWQVKRRAAERGLCLKGG